MEGMEGMPSYEEHQAQQQQVRGQTAYSEGSYIEPISRYHANAASANGSPAGVHLRTNFGTRGEE